MKKFIVIIAVVFGAIVVYSSPEIKHDQYKELDLNIIKSQPEEYYNKKVCYTSIYDKYMTTFPNYAEKNGFKAGKFYWLIINPVTFPVIAKKTKEMNEVILLLKSRCTVKVYGKIKKFRIPPQASMLPRYYLELADIQIVAEPEKIDNRGHDNDRRKQPPRYRKPFIRPSK